MTAEVADKADLLDQVKFLTDAGIKQKQAEAIVKIVEYRMAKTVSPEYLDRAFERFENKMAQQFAILDAKIDLTKAELKTEISDKVNALESKLLWKGVAFVGTLVALGVAVAKLFF